ncbi:MAG TPA: tRNA (adenosine(37)-N6)-threonylcarbamoyltransferase complex dimerization subunit type 1 TsaB [Bauldia sp.]|nr:tRNA (adenosine(37)-N6)-threonylcarbamoyltransferase complex dimerization subunit type 1 TsaB [Bauldia sp.]
MNLLAIDTSLERCSTGVAVGGRSVVLVSETIGRGHAERLFGMISAAMDEAGLAFADLDRIAVTVGPGSFTGVRIGIAAARGFALVVGCPVAGIGTLDVMADAARAIAGPVPVLAALDAKRGEVYAQAFDSGGAALSEPAVGSARNFAAIHVEGMVLAGSGARSIAAELGRKPAPIVHEDTAPDIAALVRLGIAAPAPAGPPRPLYLRPPDAKPQSATVVRQ